MPKKSTRIFIFLTFLVFGIFIIFAFSDQNGDQSHTASMYVSEKIVRALNKTFNWSLPKWDITRFTSLADGPVRKFAHICIYTALSIGIVLAFAILRWARPKPIDYLIDIGIIILVAVADEINQLYSGGRGSSWKDVIIDTVGGIAGVMFIHFFIDLIGWLKGPHRSSRTQNSKGLSDNEPTADADNSES